MGTWDGGRWSTCRFPSCRSVVVRRSAPPSELLHKSEVVYPAIVAGHSGLNAMKRHNASKLQDFAVLQEYDSK